MLESLYRGLTSLAAPIVHQLLDRRAVLGKEDPARRGERLGQASRLRPGGPLVWVHAASVGESLAVLPLVDRLLAMDPAVHVMVTTGTVTSADLMARRLPGPRAFHQYVPVDLPSAVAAFMIHWRPDLVLWIESEFWPNLLTAIRRAGVPCALVNARLSAASFTNWRRFAGTARRLLSVFQIALAQTALEAERLRQLGVNGVSTAGNLKYSASPLPVDQMTLDSLLPLVSGRPVWTFASSHAGEEEMALRAQADLRTLLPDALLLLVPRHPNRGEAVAGIIRAADQSFAQRSTGGVPRPGESVYLMDTLGEMGLVFRLAPVTVMGGSFMPVGGHNPIEPALLDSAVIHGPHMFNFAEVAAEMQEAAAITAVADIPALVTALYRLLTHDQAHNAQAAAARSVAVRNAMAVDRVMQALTPLLRQAGIG